MMLRGRKPLSITFAPAAASARAMPRPIPPVDPVTNATFPRNMVTRFYSFDVSDHSSFASARNRASRSARFFSNFAGG